jgi:hypothetical protein
MTTIQKTGSRTGGDTHAIVTISDRRFFIAVFVLIVSLRRYNVQAVIHVLSVGLSPEEKALIEQFPDVHVFEGDPANLRNPTCRKAEAILTAADTKADVISLLDADCIINGDITPYLDQEVKGLSACLKPPSEDGAVFRKRYDPDDEFGTIPKRVLAQWRQDVGERTEPAIANTACGGNLSIHRDYLDFVRRWHEQMMKVLPNRDLGVAHDFASTAYFQLDESVLNSLLAFAHKTPPLSRSNFDLNPDACVLHLGPCNPRYWAFWRKDRLRYYRPVMDLLDWARAQGYKLPKLPWALNKKQVLRVYIVAYGYEVYVQAKNVAKVCLRTLGFKF